ncbi:MAG: MFS transporter [Alphaproteobacteria bacterium]|nr:MFS transporter [Alphaproteobacteria bacterium]
MLGLTGFRLMYAPTFLPAYIFSLTGSAALVGLGQALLQLGAVASPIIGAARFEQRRRLLPYAIGVGSLMRLQILGLALAGWFLEGPILLGATMALLFLLGVFTGVQRVAFQVVMAKVIPINRRGRLQAWRNLTGGLIAALLSYFAGRYLIEHDVLGNGYATTFFISFVLTSLGLLALRLLMIEPDAPTVRARMRVIDRVREFPALLRDRDYRQFIIAQALAVGGRVAAPFYILFAARQMPLDGATIGLLSLAFLGADTVSNLVWGYMGDRMGFRITFLAALGVWIAASILLIFATSPALILASFCGLGAGISGYVMSAGTLVLEFGLREDAPMRLALSTTIEGAISSAGPILGGLVVHIAGAGTLIAIAVVLLLAAFVALLRLNDPRGR